MNYIADQASELRYDFKFRGRGCLLAKYLEIVLIRCVLRYTGNYLCRGVKFAQSFPESSGKPPSPPSSPVRSPPEAFLGAASVVQVYGELATS